MDPKHKEELEIDRVIESVVDAWIELNNEEKESAYEK